MVMQIEKSILQEKSEAFTGRVIKMYQYLTSQKNEHIVSKQVLRSGTSIGANIAESRNAQSTLDFINKLNIALKEADETNFWLNNLKIGGYLNEIEYQSIHDDCEELIRMLTSSIKTLKKRMGKL